MKFSIRKSYNKTAGEISFEKLLDRIEKPLEKDLEVFSFLRKSKCSETEEFKKKKSSLELVFWNVKFKGTSTVLEEVDSTTGFLFFDIDFPVNPQELKNNKYVHLFWTSCSGTGYGGLLRVDNLPLHVTPTLYANILKQAGLYDVCDPSCSNINRGNFISYDKNIKQNWKKDSVVIDASEIVDEEYSFEQPTQRSTEKIKNKKHKDVELNGERFYLHLSSKTIDVSKLKWGKNEPAKFYPKGVEFFEVNLYHKVKKGKRNTTLFSIASLLAYINREKVVLKSLLSYMVEINQKMCEKPLEYEEVLDLTRKALENRDNKPANTESAKKYKYVFNPNMKLTHQNKMQIIGEIRVQHNIEMFHTALEMWDAEENYTRKRMSEKINLKPNTITSWRTRFPELYADADEKIKAIKAEHKRRKEENIRQILQTKTASEKTEANWDNRRSPEFKELEKHSNGIENALKLKDGEFQEQCEFNIDGFEKNYAKDNKKENKVFRVDYNDFLYVRVGKYHVWREDGLIESILSLKSKLIPVMVCKNQKPIEKPPEKSKTSKNNKNNGNNKKQ